MDCHTAQPEVLSFGIDTILSPTLGPSSLYSSVTADHSITLPISEDLSQQQQVSAIHRWELSQRPERGQENDGNSSKHGQPLDDSRVDYKVGCSYPFKCRNKFVKDSERDHVIRVISNKGEKKELTAIPESHGDNSLHLQNTHTSRSTGICESTERIKDREFPSDFCEEQTEQCSHPTDQCSKAQRISPTVTKSHICPSSGVTCDQCHQKTQNQSNNEPDNPLKRTPNPDSNISFKYEDQTLSCAVTTVHIENGHGSHNLQLDGDGHSHSGISYRPSSPGISQTNPEPTKHGLPRPIPLICPSQTVSTSSLSLTSQRPTPPVFTVHDPNSAYLGWPLLKSLYPATSYGTTISSFPGLPGTYLASASPAAPIYSFQLPVTPRLQYMDTLTTLGTPGHVMPVASMVSTNDTDTRTRSFTVMDDSEGQGYIPRVVSYIAGETPVLSSWSSVKSSHPNHPWSEIDASRLPGKLHSQIICLSDLARSLHGDLRLVMHTIQSLLDSAKLNR